MYPNSQKASMYRHFQNKVLVFQKSKVWNRFHTLSHLIFKKMMRNDSKSWETFSLMEVIRKTGKIGKSVVLSMHTWKLFPSCGCSSSVERQLPKLDRRVRLPSSAPKKESSTRLFFFIAQFQEISFYVKNSPTKCFTGEFFLALWVLRFKCRILNHKPVQERNFN